MRELINSGSSDVVQEVYESIEPQTWAVFKTIASVHESSPLNKKGKGSGELQVWREVYDLSRLESLGRCYNPYIELYIILSLYRIVLYNI